MTKGIVNILTDKIFPAAAPGNQSKNSNPKALLFSPPATKGEANQAFKHITGQVVARQTSASQSVTVKRAGDGETQKTVGDFYREILKQQPFDAENLAKKIINVKLETQKPAAEMKLSDYQMAKDRAIFKQAGYALLTDGEIRTAVEGIKSHGSVNHGSDGLDKLRAIDKKPGAMFIPTDRATIEYAKRAGQAVLQFRQYQAKQADANQEKAKSEVNQMFADQGRVLWNSAVNTVEGTINTAIDAASTNGGTNPLPLLNPNRPQVDFSGAKSDYRSEMMRRDINGKLDGDGIKMGQAVETGVTVLAPLVIGKVFTPKVAPQSLKTLGGIPEMEAATVSSSRNVSTGGLRNELPLTKAQKAEALKYAKAFGIAEDDVIFSENMNTSYKLLFGKERLYLGTDALPATGKGLPANSRVSMRGAIAHELEGHRAAELANKTHPNDLLEEVQASIRAAKFAADLTMPERVTLIRDALERLQKAGLKIREVKGELWITKDK